MNRFRLFFPIFSKPLWKAVIPGYAFVSLGLNIVMAAGDAPVVHTPSNVLTIASTNVPATNRLNIAPLTKTVPAGTNLSETVVASSATLLDDKYKLAIGDRLSFKILEEADDPKEEYPRTIYVTDAGDIEVPYIGRVPAEKKTCRQLAADVKAALEKEYYYQATVVIAVDLMTKSHGRVYLVGAVRLPGPVELPNDEVMTLSKAILRAGGFTDYADRKHVKVTRKNAAAKDAMAGDKDQKQSFTVDVGEIFDKGKVEEDLPLETSDLVYIPERLIRF